MISSEQTENNHFIDIANPNKSHRPFNSRVVQNFILVWLHSETEALCEKQFRNSIGELRTVVNDINTFVDVDQCIDFIVDIIDEKVLMIISGDLNSNIVPLIHDIVQISSIYIFNKHQSSQKEWIQQWPKVKNIFASILSICQVLKQDAQKCDHDLVSISIVSTNRDTPNENLDQLDSTFMYTQIMKEILLAIDFNERHIKDFLVYYKKKITDNDFQLSNIDRFCRDYNNHSPIWWYTQEHCVYSVLNRALRFMEVDTIIKMGFFIQNLHNRIAQLHSEQYKERHQLVPFTIYRGQNLPKKDFDKIRESQGGLISFNNFLSTSKDLNVALDFARRSLASPQSIGIVFVITIDPSIKSTPFACITNESNYDTEEEILFSMHTVFRIGYIINVGNTDPLWQIDLIQTDDNDTQLNELTKRIHNEIDGSNPVNNLGKLLFKLGHVEEANEYYETLLDRTQSDHEKINFYHQIGWSKTHQNKYEEAIASYKKSLELKQTVMPKNYHVLAVSYNHIGYVYEKMNKLTEALLYYEEGLDFEQKITPLNYDGLASCFTKIGSVYEKMNEYSKSIEFHEKALEFRQNISPVDKMKLSYAYRNIGCLYDKMKNYEKALLSHEKVLDIQQAELPPTHHDLAKSYSMIGYVYTKMGQYVKALECHQKAVEIGERSLPGTHPQLIKWRKSLEYIKRKCSYSVSKNKHQL